MSLIEEHVEEQILAKPPSENAFEIAGSKHEVFSISVDPNESTAHLVDRLKSMGIIVPADTIKSFLDSPLSTKSMLKDLLDKKKIDEKVATELVVQKVIKLKLKDLGFDRDKISYLDILAKIDELGLECCAVETPFYFIPDHFKKTKDYGSLNFFTPTMNAQDRMSSELILKYLFSPKSAAVQGDWANRGFYNEDEFVFRIKSGSGQK